MISTPFPLDSSNHLGKLHNRVVNRPNDMFRLFYYIIFQFYSDVKVFFVLSVNIPNFYRYYSLCGSVLRGMTKPVYQML